MNTPWKRIIPAALLALGIGATNAARADAIAVIDGPSLVTPGATVQFDGSGSYSTLGLPISFAWDLDNDGQFDDGNTAIVDFHVPIGALVGTFYSISLKVSELCGCYDIATVRVKVAPPQVPVPAPALLMAAGALAFAAARRRKTHSTSGAYPLAAA